MNMARERVWPPLPAERFAQSSRVVGQFARRSFLRRLASGSAFVAVSRGADLVAFPGVGGTSRQLFAAAGSRPVAAPFQKPLATHEMVPYLLFKQK